MNPDPLAASSPLIGIDFGTTKTMVAVYDPKKKVAIPQQLGRGRFELPTSIYATEESGLLFGDEAEDEGESDLVNLSRRFKLRVGMSGPPTMGRVTKSADELTRLYLHHVRRRLEEDVLHQPVANVVLTVPAIFGPSQRNALTKAAKEAGFKQVELLDEPAAAGIAYCDHHQARPDIRFLVADWGGGTFDVALVERSPNHDEPHIVPGHVTGLDDIGGEVLDDHLWNMVSHTLVSVGHRPLNAQERYNWGRYRREITRAKERLSDVESVKMSFVVDGGSPVRVDFDRGTLEEAIGEIVGRAAAFVDQLLQRCRDEGTNPDFVLLAGGTARIPMIRRVWNERLKMECRSWSQGREAIAIGAAIHARNLWAPRAAVRSSSVAASMNFSEGTEDIFERTRALVCEGRGIEAFSIAEQALQETQSDSALDAWMLAMETVPSRDRVVSSAKMIAASVHRQDLSACVLVLATVLADWGSPVEERCMEWLSHLGDDIHTYPHAVAAYSAKASSKVDNKDVDDLGELIVSIRSDSMLAPVIQAIRKVHSKAEPLEVLAETVRRLQDLTHSPYALCQVYLSDFLLEIGEQEDGRLSSDRRKQLVKQIERIAWGTFVHRLVVAVDAFRESRDDEFLRLCGDLLENSFCAPFYRVLLYRFQAAVHQRANPPRILDAAGCLEAVVGLDFEEDGSGYAEWASILMQAGNQFGKSRGRDLLKKAIEACEQGLEIFPEAPDLRSQLIVARLSLARLAFGWGDGGARLAQLNVQLALEDAVENLRRDPGGQAAQTLLFSCCMLKEGMEHCDRVWPFFNDETTAGAVEGYLGRFLDEDEFVMFIYDAAFVNTGSVGVSVTTRRIVGSTRFSGLVHVYNWEGKALDWDSVRHRFKVGHEEIPYGSDIGRPLCHALERYKALRIKIRCQ